jgi:rhamnose utilization protein RhaD (predicted bifunctional aldolase and dehydrogenase)
MSTIWDPSRVSGELVELTKVLGAAHRDLVILAEGNTSQRMPDGSIAVKASGTSMAAAGAEDFVLADAAELVRLLTDPEATQARLSAELDAGTHGGIRRRASIEAPLHAVIQVLGEAAFIAHTHPTDVVSVLASVHGPQAYEYSVYSDEAVVLGRPLYVPYAQPGIELGRLFHLRLQEYLDSHGELPSLVLLGNHGIVAIGTTPQAVDGITAMAVKGARIRVGAHSMGGVVPVPEESLASFFDRSDILDRRRLLAGNQGTGHQTKETT